MKVIHNVIKIIIGLYRYRTPLFGTTLDWYWTISQAKDGRSSLTEGVDGSGILSGLYRYLIEKQCGEAFEKALTNIKGICEKK